jgi:hypothetical protein
MVFSSFLRLDVVAVAPQTPRLKGDRVIVCTWEDRVKIKVFASYTIEIPKTEGFASHPCRKVRDKNGAPFVLVDWD